MGECREGAQGKRVQTEWMEGVLGCGLGWRWFAWLHLEHGRRAGYLIFHEETWRCITMLGRFSSLVRFPTLIKGVMIGFLAALDSFLLFVLFFYTLILSKLCSTLSSNTRGWQGEGAIIGIMDASSIMALACLFCFFFLSY